MNHVSDWASLNSPKKTTKHGVFLKINEDTLLWFRSQGKGYQNCIDDVLCAYVDYKKKEAIKKAQEYYRDFHANCFWHCDPLLKITADNVQLVVDGLRKNGGKKEFTLASEIAKEILCQ